MEIPLSEQGLEETKGSSFFYARSSPQDPAIEGIFAFSFYIHYADSATPENMYLRGISMYLDAIEAKDSVFSRWKIVLYTDAFTVDILKDLALRIATSPHVDLVIVTWPYYSQTERQVNGDVLRCMRLRSFFDFPDRPVFLRDADTLWAINDYATGRKTLNTQPAQLLKWESTFYESAKRYPATFVLGTSLAYKQRWHHNKGGKRFAPLGAFAGFQSALPRVPCFQTKELWEEAVRYILSRSRRTAGRFSNEDDSMNIGKDEQILTFLFVPACLPSIFFFELDMYNRRTKATKNVSFYDPMYPTVIFERGSNVNLKALFEEGIASGFATNLSQKQQEIFARNQERSDAEDKVILETLRTLGNTTDTLGGLRITPISHSGAQYYSLSRIKDSLASLDSKGDLQELYDAYVQAEKAFEAKRTETIKKLRVKGPAYSEERVLDELRGPMEMKNQLIRTFLDKALGLLPRAELEAKLKRNHGSTKEMTRILNWYEGKPIAPQPPPPSLSSLGLGKFAMVFDQKKGGTRQKRKHRKGKTQRKNRLLI